jgi:7,8-dihydropterin-6-yl-methyl-4-(beta-D-ribofuranosyl)aminobenzene 5'-phosphate synthase
MKRFLHGGAGAAVCLCLASAWVCAAEADGDRQFELEIRVVFDNTSAREDLRRSWGFSAVVDFGGHRVLFDAGSDPILLLEHLEKMQIDPKTIEHAVISHQHGDHLRGVYWVFEKNPAMQVHFLDCFPDEAFRRATAVKMKPHRVTEPFEVVPGVYSTGIVEGEPPEQSLVIETSRGLVMLVGCSHPGVVKLVETAQTQRKKDSLRLLLGGFHMLRKRPDEIKTAINRLQGLNVQTVIPAHCSGDLAKELFPIAYGDQFNTAGAGRRIVIDDRGKLVISTLKAEKEPGDE